MSSQTITAYFEADHARLDELFTRYQENKRMDFPHAKQCFKDFKSGLERHIVWEEEILFPLFEEKTGLKGAGPTAVMRFEHREIKEALEKIHDKVKNKNPETEAEERALLDTLKDHNCKEENILYPGIDSVISEEERGDIFLRMESLPEERYGSCCPDH